MSAAASAESLSSESCFWKGFVFVEFPSPESYASQTAPGRGTLQSGAAFENASISTCAVAVSARKTFCVGLANCKNARAEGRSERGFSSSREDGCVFEASVERRGAAATPSSGFFSCSVFTRRRPSIVLGCVLMRGEGSSLETVLKGGNGWLLLVGGQSLCLCCLCLPEQRVYLPFCEESGASSSGRCCNSLRVVRRRTTPAELQTAEGGLASCRGEGHDGI